MIEDNATEEVEHGSVTKYWWFLMIIPVGLIIGTITSTCNHLKHDREKDEMAEYRVSEEISKRSLKDDLSKAFESPKQDSKITLKGISSSNGLNHYLKLRPVGDGTGSLGYYDLKAKQKNDQDNILAIVLELDEADVVSRATMIAINIAVMKSVFGETDFKHTLRFVFIPSSKSNVLEKPEILTLNKEKLIDYFVIRPMDQPAFEKVGWIENNHIISHPALDRKAEQIVTERQLNFTFEAAKQLRSFLLEKL